MKKSLIALFLCLILAFGLFGCKKAGDDPAVPPVEPTPVVTKPSMDQLREYLDLVETKRTSTVEAIIAEKNGVSVARTVTAEVGIELGSGTTSSKTGMTFDFSSLKNLDAESSLDSVRAELNADLGAIFGGKKNFGVSYTENRLYIKGDFGSEAEAFLNVIDFTDFDSEVLTEWIEEMVGKIAGVLPEFPVTGVDLATGEEEESFSLSVIADVLTMIGLSEEDANACLGELVELVADLNWNTLFPVTQTVFENDTVIEIEFEYSILKTLIDEIFELGAEYAAKIDESAAEQWQALTSAVSAFLPKGVGLTITQRYRDDVLQKTEIDFSLLLNVAKTLSLSDFSDLSKVVSEQIAAYETKDYHACTVAIKATTAEATGDPQKIAVENPDDYGKATDAIADAFDAYVLSMAEEALNEICVNMEDVIAADPPITVTPLEEGDEAVEITAFSDLAKLSSSQLEAITGADTFTYAVSADETRLTLVTERINLYGVTCRYSVSVDYQTREITSAVESVTAA